VLKLTYGNVELKKCFGGILTPEPPFQGRDRSGGDGTGRKGRGGQRRGGDGRGRVAG